MINLLACGLIYITPIIMQSAYEDVLRHKLEDLANQQVITIDTKRLDELPILQNEHLKGMKSLAHYLHKPPGTRNLSLGLIMLLINTAFLAVLSFRKENTVQQAGPAYPPQGVGSADP